MTKNPQADPELASRQAIFFIHGYNTTLTDARKAYASFLNPFYDQAKVLGLSADDTSGYIKALSGDTLNSISRWGEICLVFWPAGNSATSYVKELKMAAASATTLSRLLLGLIRAPQPQIALVCHSMGNRLALQMLSTPNPVIPCRTMCLMAAAVAVQMVTGSAQPYFWPSIAAIERKRVLYSKSDYVLEFAFPAGEAAAAEGILLQAVGSAGRPSYAWTDTKDMQPYGHGDYWPAVRLSYQGGTTSRKRVLDFLSTTMLPYPFTPKIQSNPGPASSSITTNAIGQSQTPTHRIGT